MTEIESRVFDGCTELETVMMPNHRLRTGHALFAKCRKLATIVVSDSHRIFQHLLDRWEVPLDTRIVLHGELRLSLLFAEMSAEETTKERREELEREIRKHLAKTGHRRRKVSKK